MTNTLRIIIAVACLLAIGKMLAVSREPAPVAVASQ